MKKLIFLSVVILLINTLNVSANNESCKTIRKQVSSSFYTSFKKITSPLKISNSKAAIEIQIDEQGNASTVNCSASTKELEALLLKTVKNMKKCEKAKGELLSLKIKIE